MEGLCYWKMHVLNNKSEIESHPTKSEICTVQLYSSPTYLEIHCAIVLSQKAVLICKTEPVGTRTDTWEYFSEEKKKKKKGSVKENPATASLSAGEIGEIVMLWSLTFY